MTDFSLYNSAAEYIGDGTFDLDDATANKWGAVFVKGDYIVDAAHSTFNDINVANLADNMAANTIALTGVAWNRVTNTVTMIADDITFTASGGYMNGDYLIIYQDADAGGDQPPANTDKLLAFSNIGFTPVADTGTLNCRDASNNSQINIVVQKVV